MDETKNQPQTGAAQNPAGGAQPKPASLDGVLAQMAGNPVHAQPAQSEVLVQPTVLDENLFYNVMPPININKGVVAPQVVAEQAPAAPKILQNGGKPGFLKKYLKLIIIVLVIIILGAAGYYIYNKNLENQVNSASQSINNRPAPKQPDPAALALAAWNQKYFGSDPCLNKAQAECSPTADPDHDGLINSDEMKLGTDPKNPDSDGDGISDGDEVHIFGTDPANAHSAGNNQFDDASYIRGGFDIAFYKQNQKDQKLTADQIAQITLKMQSLGLHDPTAKTLGTSLTGVYKFTPLLVPPASTTNTTTSSSTLATTTPAGFDPSPQAKADRDAQRSTTITNVGIALIKYQLSQGSFPDTTVFADMVDNVKIYYPVAINPIDPINQPPFAYGYQPSDDGRDFALSYYSETQNLILTKHLADSQKDIALQQAGVNDEKRKNDLKNLQTALLLYSGNNTPPTGLDYVFPKAASYKAAISPKYIASIPADPKTGANYPYAVSAALDSFTVKAILEAPPTGMSGYVCDQGGCNFY